MKNMFDEWEFLFENKFDLFRYNLCDFITDIIENENRSKLVKILIHSENVKSVSYKNNDDLTTFEEYNENLFNFTKIKSEEEIAIINTNERISKVIINNFPIAKYHCLLIPFIYEKIPQHINDIEILRIVESLRKNYINDEIFDDLVIGFNSKGATSSVNHLHFHLLSLNSLSLNINQLMIINQSKELETIKEESKWKLCLSECFGFTFYEYSFEDFDECIEDVFEKIQILNNKSIPYNMVILKNKCLLLPRKHQNIFKSDFGFLEFLGYIPRKDEEFLNNYSFSSIQSDFSNLNIL